MIRHTVRVLELKAAIIIIISSSSSRRQIKEDVKTTNSYLDYRRKNRTVTRHLRIKMSEPIADNENEIIQAEADSIALKLTGFLIDGFKTKEGRDPSLAEIQQLMEELTEER